MRHSLRLGLLVPIAALACGGSGRRLIDPADRTPCPGDGLTVCTLRLERAPGHPRQGQAIRLENVLVSTPTIAISSGGRGFYVQDPPSTNGLAGRYSGILVELEANVLANGVPPIGEIVAVDGLFDQAPEQPVSKRLRATGVTRSGRRGQLRPVAIESAERVGTGGQDAPAYEGVLIKLEVVGITESPAMINLRPYDGAFRVDNALIVGPGFYAVQRPSLGAPFSSLAGVLRLGTGPVNGGEYELSPRFVADVLFKSDASVARRIVDLQDPDSPGRPIETCRSDNGSRTMGKCAVADLRGVVVTAVGGYVSRNLRAIWVQDPAVPDGRFAGIKVVYNPGSIVYLPEVGHLVDVKGDSILYRGGMQIQSAKITRSGEDLMLLPPTVVQPEQIASKSPETHVYEGVFVAVENARVDLPCLEDDKLRDQGGWKIAGDVQIGTDFFYAYNGRTRPASVMCLDALNEPTGACSCEAKTRPGDQRTLGDTFSRISGVVDYAFGAFELNPRGDGDLVKN